jgi:hypothetical protein
MSRQPGTSGINETAPGTGEQAFNIDQEFQRLTNAENGSALHRFAVNFLGDKCFAVGMIVGIGTDVITSVVGILELALTFVMADLHDLRSGEWNWWHLSNPVYWPNVAAAKIAEIAFDEELRGAAIERDELVREIGEAFKDPEALFEGMVDSIKNGYVQDWKNFNTHISANTLEGRYEAGKIFGVILFDVLSIVTGIAALGKGAAKLAGKLPRLFKAAKTVKIKPGTLLKQTKQTKTSVSTGGAGGGGGGGGGTAGTGKVPTKPTARPKASKGGSKPPKKREVRLNDDCESHITLEDPTVPRKRGIGGAHNAKQFDKAAAKHKVEVVSRKPHPDIDGVEIVEYRMPALDKAGNPTGKFKNKVHTKTIYDPKKIPDEKMMKMGQEAATEAQSRGELTREWTGTTSEGVPIRGYLDENGNIKSFFVD